MKVHMNTMMVLTLAGMISCGTWVRAENAAAETVAAGMDGIAQVVKVKTPRHSLKSKEVVLTGNLTQQEVKVAGKAHSVYVLVTAAGEKLRLPAIRVAKHSANASAIHYADFLGQNVKAVVMASEQKKGDKTFLKVRKIKLLEKVSVLPSEPAHAA